MPFPVVALFGLIKVACVVCGAVFCTHKITKAYKKGQNTKQMKYKNQEEARKAAQDANKKIDTEKSNLENKVKPNEIKIQELEKKAEEETKKSKDPSLTEEERIYHRNKAKEYMDEIDKLKKENQGYYNKLKELDKQKKENDKVINSTGLIHSRDDWIWEVLTLENILIVLAIYALYNIVRDERK